uniref:Uncharacterized protein n=1 Tax=Ananas comosus var. bracteatus TaxID=296719 RepID=A0A6V7PNX0_ANACO|nr:unnamed protein product [Ananas comosus var. bracteatus]
MKVELMSSESEERGLEESMTSESEESGHEESMTSENEDAELEEEGEHDDDDDDDIFYDSDQSFNAVDVDLAEKLRTAFPFHSSADFYFRIILIQDDAPENINQEGEDLMGQLATIPYSAVMGVLADDAVTVQSEDTVYQFLVRWTAEMYRGQTRSEVWELDFMGRTGVTRFNYMSLDKLEKILNEDEMLFPRSFTERAVSEAKVYKKSIPNLRSLPPQKRMRQYKTVPLRMVETLHSRSIFVELSGNQVFNLLPLRTEQFPFLVELLFFSLVVRVMQETNILDCQ